MKQKRITTATLLAVPAFAALFALPLLNTGMTASAAGTDEISYTDTDRRAMGNEIQNYEYVGDAEEKKVLRRNAPGNRGNALPSQLDLSQSPYFPEIGDQMYVGSCYAFSSTYYQFTYEVNKYNGITTTTWNTYSPAFIYNYMTSNNNYGGVCTNVYEFLREHGALLLSEMPYRAADGSTVIDEDNYDYSLSTDTDAMVRALHTRLKSHGALTIPGTGTPITGPTSSSLNEVKQMLNDGKVLIVQIDAFNWNYRLRNDLDASGNVVTYYNEDNKYEYVAARGYRVKKYDGGHEMTVVGYDDSVWYDFNGNGIKEEAELGAFKVANSWGTDYRNDGYIWVMYDALNRVSAVPGNWEDGWGYTRLPIFDRSEDMWVNGEKDVNAFYYMNVENKDVYYVGQLDVTANDGVSLNVTLCRNNPGSPVVTSRTVLDNPTPRCPIPYEGTLAFDFADLCDPIGNYLAGYTWYVRLEGDYTRAAFRVTDDFSNTIYDYGELDNGYATCPINLVDGDLNYDGSFTQADRDIYESGVALSTLQEYLAANIHIIPDPDNDITATASVVTAWDGGQIIAVTVKNNGNQPVSSWALQTASMEGDVISIWGADLLEGNIIRAASYTAQIPAGGEVTFGYQVANPTGNLPVFTAINSRTDVTGDCTVLLDASNSWGDGFVGFITITNNSDTDLTAWELTFNAEGFTITDACGLSLTTNTDGSYTVAGTNGSYVIPAHSSITIQFIGSLTDTPSINVLSLTAAA